MALTGTHTGFRGQVRRLRRMRRRARQHTMMMTAAMKRKVTPKARDTQDEAHFLVRQIRKQAEKLAVQRAAHAAAT